jgi:hypothetical protein
MNQLLEDHKKKIETLTIEKEAFLEQIAGLNERNKNQVGLLKRLEFARQADRKEFEAQMNVLKEELLQERIKSKNDNHFENDPLSPSPSNRTRVASPPIEKNGHHQNGESKHRRVSKEEWKDYKEAGLSSEPPNAVIIQSAFLDEAMKKKELSQRGFWGNLFGPNKVVSENGHHTTKPNPLSKKVLQRAEVRYSQKTS